ncbi:YbaN family protein [Phenylobacterium deserti]|uniref:DUF454 domain-containing protein n=1 Tax=Phenylobacterium deserti TaxID=1914756 RepID=A0A328ANQ9_9CAUL|nr:YbaN family protein [Phenylobacterium deserti]RAK56643.1 DUF454 domain-containing protein [Phenylobacterium deserti]
MSRPPVRILAYRALGFAALGLAAIGVVLPVMPTTVFLLIAVWAFARGSPELADRVRRHPRYGPLLVDWETRHAIPRRAKIAAVSMMAVSVGVVWFGSRNLILTGAVGAILLAVGCWIVTRPN